MPKIVASGIEAERYFTDYVNTYLDKDIRDYAHIGKMHAFTDFLIYMAAHTSQELNYANIAGEIGISAPTAKEWVSILESSGVIYLLRPYFNNVTKRLVKTPKMYFMDTGLAAYLTRWTSAETIQNGAMNGAFFETYVVSEIVKSYLHAGKQPVEIKRSSSPAHPDKIFRLLQDLGWTFSPALSYV